MTGNLIHSPGQLTLRNARCGRPVPLGSRIEIKLGGRWIKVRVLEAIAGSGDARSFGEGPRAGVGEGPLLLLQGESARVVLGGVGLVTARLEIPDDEVDEHTRVVVRSSLVARGLAEPEAIEVDANCLATAGRVPVR